MADVAPDADPNGSAERPPTGLISGATTRWRSFSPLTRALTIFLFINTLIFNVALAALPTTGPRETGAYHAVRFLLRRTADDSWYPMSLAWYYLRDGGDRVYETIFFGDNIKFQYAPTSVIPIEVMEFFLPGDTVHFGALNLISWLAVWTTAIFVALIFERAAARYTPELLRVPAEERWLRLAVIALFTLSFYPIVKAYSLGQIQTWINGLFAILLYLWLINQPRLGGVITGLICVIKPQLGLLLVWGALRRQWSFSIALAVTFGAFGLASLALYGLSNHLDYLEVLSYISRRGEAYYPNQSVNGVLNRLLDNGNNVDFTSNEFPPFDPIVYAGTIGTSVVLVALALFWRMGDARHDSAIDLCIASLTFTIASPIAWEHHYGILAPMYALAVPAMLRWPVFGKWSMPYLAVSYVLASNFFDVAQEVAGVPALTPLQAYLLLGAAMLLFALYRLRAAAATDAAFALEQPSAADATTSTPTAAPV